jgi:hypothetical protein
LLLDDRVDRRLARDITGHEVSTVVGLGWTGVEMARCFNAAPVGSMHS